MLLNHQNWTSITQVIDLLAILAILARLIVQIFGTDFRLGKVRIWTSILQGNCISI